jgi:hypothetical protein
VAQLLRPRPNPDGSWAHNPSLASLGLQWDNIGAAGARAVANALQPHLQSDGQRTFNRALKDLNFRRNPIGDGGVAALAGEYQYPYRYPVIKRTILALYEYYIYYK